MLFFRLYWTQHDVKSKVVIVISDGNNNSEHKHTYYHVYFFEWIEFCYKKRAIILKENMTDEEKKTYVNSNYFCNKLPELDKCVKIKKTTTKKKKYTPSCTYFVL